MSLTIPISLRQATLNVECPSLRDHGDGAMAAGADPRPSGTTTPPVVLSELLLLPLEQGRGLVSLRWVLCLENLFLETTALVGLMKGLALYSSVAKHLHGRKSG